jgi:hypothetical protein
MTGCGRAMTAAAIRKDITMKTCVLLAVVLLLVCRPAAAAEILYSSTDAISYYTALPHQPGALDFDADGDGLPDIPRSVDGPALTSYSAVDIYGNEIWSYELDSDAVFAWAGGCDRWMIELEGFLSFEGPNSRDALFDVYCAEGVYGGLGGSLIVSLTDNRVLLNLMALRPQYVADFDGDGSAELVAGFAGETEIWSGAGISSAGDGEPVGAASLYLNAIAPNPFNPVTTLSFTAPHTGEATIRIFDLRGREVDRQTVMIDAPGTRSFTWRGTDHSGRLLPSGVYLARVTSGGEETVGRMTLVR